MDAYSGRFNTNLDISKISGDNENRKFYLVKSSGDVYSLVSKKTGQQLYNDGTNVCLKTCSNFYVLEKAVEGVSVQRDSVDVIVGEPYDLSEIMTVLPENASNKDVLWASSDDKIASVNNGIVNGILPGKCTITMTTKDGGYSANCEVTVNDGGNVGGTCGDNITWQIINTPDYYMDQSSILILSGSGSMDNYSGKEGAPWAVYAHRITDVVIGNDITSIGDFAFSNMKKIETIAVPSGVKTIGKHAFDGCGTIERLSLAESVESVKQGAFDNCDISKVSYEGTDREHLSLCSNAQTYGGNDAFCNAEWTCSGGISDEGYLRDVYWKYAENVLTVSSVYSGQTMDQSQGIPWEDYYVKEIIIDYDEANPKDFIYQTGYIFNYNDVLEKVTIPSVTYHITDGTFRNCTHLKEVVFKDVVNKTGFDNSRCSIGVGAFANCFSLKTIEIPDRFTLWDDYYGDSAFLNCISLNEVHLPNQMEKIPSAMFAGCINLQEIDLPDSVTSFGKDSFLCAGLTAIEFPINTSEIGNQCFAGCKELRTIDLSKTNISKIGMAAFKDSGIKTVSLPKTIETIGNVCFNDCKELSNVVYSGSEDEWKSVGIGDYNEPLISAAFTFLNECTIVINENPQDIVAADGEEVEISAEITGEEVVSTPQISNDGGTTWTHLLPEDDDEENVEPLNANVKLNTMAQSEESDSCSITVTADINEPDLCYRFEVTDKTGSVRHTHPVTVIVVDSKNGTVIDDPDNQTISIGDTVSFAVEAKGNGLTYQWRQCAPDAEDWVDSVYEGNKTDTLTVTATEENVGTQFKCIITDKDGTEFESDVSILDVKKDLQILDQPSAPTGEVGYDTSMWINVSGTEVSYRWQLVEDDADQWEDCEYEGSDTSELIIPVSEDTYNDRFRCIVTDRYGNEIISESAPVLYPETTIDMVDASIATLKSHTLSLTGDIGIIYNFYLSDDALNDKGAKVMFTYSGKDQGSVPVSAGVKKTDKNGKDYYGYCCEVHSSQMTGKTIAKVVLSDGRESEEFPYTVKDYADIIIANKNNSAAFTQVTPLVKAMLNYGGYAQEFFKYDTSLSLANADLTEAERDVSGVKTDDLAKYATVKQGTAPEGIKYKSATLQLTSTTTIRYSFTLAEGHDISEYTFKNGDEVLKPELLSDNVYCVYINNVASDELDNMYTISVGNFSVTYGALTYAYNQLKKDSTTDELKNLLRAMVLYNKEANEYFA